MSRTESKSPSVFLTGFMGCGKSTVGRLLASELGSSFVDLDDEIERRAGRSISEVFAEEGEGAFRDLEHEALREQAALIRSGSPRVVALGGGAFVFERNRTLIESVGRSVWLDAPADVLWERVRNQSHRPLAKSKNTFLALLEKRIPHYAFATLRVDATAPPAEATASILQVL